MAIPGYLLAHEYPGLNGLRGMSITCVVLAHAFHGRENLFTTIFSGEWGVLMFFVISGFLITTLLIKEKHAVGRISLRKFYIRRALRIFPVAYLYVLVMLVLAVLGVAELEPRAFIGAGLYLRNLPQFDSSGWLLGHYWSLSVEEQFYLVVPVLLLLLTTKAFLTYCVALIIAAWASVYLAYHGMAHVIGMRMLASILIYQVPLAVGSCAALLVCSGRLVVPRFSLATTLALLCASAYVYSRWCPLLPDVVKPFVCSIPLALVVLSSIQQSRGVVYTALNNRLIVFIGVLSYSLYIWQQAFTGAPLLRFGSSALTISVNLVLLFVVAACSYYLFERRFLKFKARFA